MSTPPTPSAPSSLATSVFSLPPKSVSDAEARAARAAKWRFSTQCVAVDTKDQYGASSTPIYQTATFKGMDGQYDYTRSGNPTRSGLGMTCLDVILRLVKPGETVLAGDDLYGGTNRLLTYVKSHGGVNVVHADTTRVDALLPHLKEGNKVKMVLLESPTNPLLKIADLVGISAAVKAASPSALVVVDNTMMSPYLQRPLEYGADLVYDSGTKYLSGHHDLMAGIVAARDEQVCKDIAFLINSVGSGLAPFDSFLLLRGLKTLSLRMDRQQATTQLVAAYLDQLGFLVHYPGLASHPNRDIHYKQATGAGAVLSFVTGDKELSERIVGAARLWGISVSFGAVNSLISMPCLMSAERGLPENLIRLCVGIEDPRDLIDDLEHALLSAGAIVPSTAAALSGDKLDAAYATDAEVWAVERARAFRRPASPDQLAAGVEKGLALGAEHKTIDGDVVVSAPGKVILFGEHAVVHGVTAIATSVNLRCFAVLSPRRDDKVGLVAPDLGIDVEYDIEALPWSLLPVSAERAEHADKELDPALVAALEAVVTGTDGKKTAAAVAYLYLYMLLAGSATAAPGATLTVSANLPISAGLGSSAAYSTCVAAALLLAHGRVAVPGAGASFSARETDAVDGWAFLAEKVLHGNPSGIDNAVSVRGGGVRFQRAVGGKQGGLDGLHGFSSLRLLLTNTRVPRDTKSLVAGVSALRLAKPDVVDPVLDAIQAIADEATALLSTPTARATLVARLEALIEANHAHLVTLDVSHPALEMIVAATAASPFGLKTKLTGAGGGGCALTLIPDDFDNAKLALLIDALRGHGFEPHLTTLGGPGLGAAVTGGGAAKKHVEPGADEGTVVPASAGLRDAGIDGLERWAEQIGEWRYT